MAQVNEQQKLKCFFTKAFRCMYSLFTFVCFSANFHLQGKKINILLNIVMHITLTIRYINRKLIFAPIKKKHYNREQLKKNALTITTFGHNDKFESLCCIA